MHVPPAVRSLPSADAVWASLQRFAERHRTAIAAAPALLLAALVCRLPALASFSLSIDDEHTSWRTNPTVWAQQGRWVNWLLESFVIDQACVPFFLDLTLCASLAVSYLLLLQAHRLSVGPLSYVAFPLFCDYPQWDLISEFYGNMPGIACGLVCTAWAGLLFQRSFVRRRPGGTACGGALSVPLVLLVATATGCYQSFLFMFLAVGMGVILRAWLAPRPPSVDASARQVVALAAVAIAGLVVHQAIAAAVLWWLGATEQYVGGYFDVPSFLAAPLAELQRSLRDARRALLGSSKAYGMDFWGAGVLMVAGWGALLAADGTWRPTLRKCASVVLAAGVCLAPFVLHPFARGPLPQRAMVAIPYVAWLFAIVPHLLPRKGWRLLAAAGLVIATVQSLYLTSTSAAARHLVAEHDRQMAGELYARLASVHEDFDRERVYPVAFIGGKPYLPGRYPTGPDGTAHGSFFGWDGGRPGRMIHYMQLLGFTNIRLVRDERLGRVSGQAAGMPNWPAAGSVKVIDGVTVFKLGPAPPRP